MNCVDVRREELVERYLLGQLDGAERDAFERHFFECDACFEEVDNMRALQGELRRLRGRDRAAVWARRRPLWAAVAAAVVLLLLVGWWTLRPTSAPEPGPSPVARVAPTPSQAHSAATPTLPSKPDRDAILAELGRVDPPPFGSVILRGTPSEARRHFREAMQDYARGDYAAAIPGLRHAADLDAGAPDILFFLGACYLLTGQTDLAIAQLRATIALGDTPFLEEARFYLAKAHVRAGDLEAAGMELREVIALEGELRDEAAGLLETLEQIASPQRNP